MIDLDAIRARDADDYAAADVLRNIRSAGNTDPELEATINMIADRHALLSAYDALRSRLAEAERDAERYRWLRTSNWLASYGWAAAELDVAVDAARDCK